MLYQVPKAAKQDCTLRLADGRMLGYAEYGDPSGVAMLAFHGMPGSRFMFQRTHALGVELGMRVIAVERPGFGLSSPHPRRSLHSFAADIAALTDALGIKRFAVAGVSAGGPYAAACAALLPERVTALAMVSPVGPMAGPEAPSGIGAGHTIAFHVGPRLMPLLAGIFSIGRALFLYAPQVMIGIMLGRCAASDRAILSRREIRTDLLQAVAAGMRPGVGGCLQDMRIFSQPWNIPFQDITAPAFLWMGLADRNVPVAAALHLGEFVPGCHVKPIETAGHYWIYDNIREVMTTILDAVHHQPVRQAVASVG